jgi:hypothetical protein
LLGKGHADHTKARKALNEGTTATGGVGEFHVFIWGGGGGRPLRPARTHIDISNPQKNRLFGASYAFAWDCDTPRPDQLEFDNSLKIRRSNNLTKKSPPARVGRGEDGLKIRIS